MQRVVTLLLFGQIVRAFAYAFVTLKRYMHLRQTWHHCSFERMHPIAFAIGDQREKDKTISENKEITL